MYYMLYGAVKRFSMCGSRVWLGGKVCNSTGFLPRADPTGAVKAAPGIAVCNHSVVNLALSEQVSPSAEQFAFE